MRNKIIILTIITMLFAMPVNAGGEGNNDLVNYLLKARDGMSAAAIATAKVYIPFCKGNWKNFANGKITWLQTKSYCSDSTGYSAARLFIEAQLPGPPKGWTEKAWKTFVVKITERIP